MYSSMTSVPRKTIKTLEAATILGKRRKEERSGGGVKELGLAFLTINST